MTEWYYARGGQQSGPVTFEQLGELARSGGLHPKDLVWTSTMKDWTPAGQVPGLFVAPAIAGRPPRGSRQSLRRPPKRLDRSRSLHRGGAGGNRPGQRAHRYRRLRRNAASI